MAASMSMPIRRHSRLRRATATAVLALILPLFVAEAARAAWQRQIDRLVGGESISVAVAEEGSFLYRHREARRRTPASNEKLLLSMAILQAMGPDARLATQAATPPVASGVVPGDLWILGQGDPALGRGRIEHLASEIQEAGVIRIDGSVQGSTGYFKRDWRAPGWKRDFPRTQVALPTALTFEGNEDRGVHIRDPEVRAAKALTEELERRGVVVAGRPGSGPAPAGLVPIAEVRSPPLIELLDYMNRYSSNFFAEVLGKRLGAERAGAPGSIAKGAAAIRSWAGSFGVRVRARDGSGLSYSNRVSPAGIVRLLDRAEDEVWGESLREALPEPGQGTLQGRMRHVDVHAKTGTLTGISALSGWVFLRRRDVWAEFSILSRGMDKDRAVRIEDRIVRILWRSAA
jgi:D-alanyl-D-alanine carboxypeptidase/D-alanyl-D-alanine-endopeptidase (penicillin-binding protein 4)